MWWRRFKRKQRFRRKKQITYLLLLALMFSMSLGYAVLNTSLNISGISSLANAKWDIHFDNIVVKEGSVTPTVEPTITNDTTVSFSVTLENPGDYYEFNIDVVNAGTINAMIDSFTILPVLTVEQQKYLDYIVTYEDGVSLAENQRLNAGTSETLRIAFIYKEGAPEDYPDEDEDIPIEVSITYVQEDEDAEDVNHPPTLYNVLKDAAKDGTYAAQYTGNHHDSFTEVPSKKIYYWHVDDGSHWYGSAFTKADAILDKNNVIFAGQCWRMIRTTDTGGVKLLYNGEPVDNKCLSTRGTHVGYNKRMSQNFASNYWYGTDYSFNSTTQVFTISGTTEQAIWNDNTSSGLIGKYTCLSSNKNDSCSTLYYVESYYNANSAYLIPLKYNSKYSEFGKTEFNATFNFNLYYRSPAHAGYMYGDVYTFNSAKTLKTQSLTASQNLLPSATLDTSYWFADSIDYGNIAANKYSLINPYRVNSTADYSSLVGKYTFRNASQTYSVGNVYYIALVNDSKMYFRQLKNGELMSDFDPIVFGDSITDNGNGTYTINNTTSVTLTNWNTDYANFNNKYTCNTSSATCEAPRYVTSTTATNYKYLSAGDKIMLGKGRDGLSLTETLLVREDELLLNSNNYNDYKYTCNSTDSTCAATTLKKIDSFSTTGYDYKPLRYFGSGVEWNGTNYTLIDPIEIEPFDESAMSTHHYMCLTDGTTECSTVVYIYYYTGTDSMIYITLKDGVTTVAKALEGMLTKNTTSSTIKNAIEAWYKHYLLEDYDEYIEDTIFCNDRSIKSLGGWKDDGGITTEPLKFKGYDEIPDLSCANITDQFSVSNPNAPLIYKVGLITSPEMALIEYDDLGASGGEYFLATPYYVSGGFINIRVQIFNDINGRYTNDDNGVRPAISLKPGITYSSGDGSMANPYVVNTD